MNINRLLYIMTTALFGILGGVVGWIGGSAYAQTQGTAPFMRDVVTFTICIGSAIVMARVGSWLADRMLAGLGRVNQLSAADRVLGIVGMLLGLLFGTLITLALPNSPTWMIPVKLFVMTATSATGLALLQGMRDEMLRVFPVLNASEVGSSVSASPKIMDTNIIIDGRILELCRTGFIEGPILVPYFVLHEVQYIADSEDAMRRARGRRGLETLGEMREIMVQPAGAKEPVHLVQVLQEVPPIVRGAETVDAKLVVLARELNASILTNDFNLNRVAELQGVRVLNLNALALALKPVALPGEEMTVTIVREGKENGQGVGYLEDGTMVVVSDARSHIGQVCKVSIAQVIQTVAGKMIFADLKSGANESNEGEVSGDEKRSHNGGNASSNAAGSASNSSANSSGNNYGDDLGSRSGGGVRRKSRA